MAAAGGRGCDAANKIKLSRVWVGQGARDGTAITDQFRSLSVDFSRRASRQNEPAR